MGEAFSTQHRMFWSRFLGVGTAAYVMLAYPRAPLPSWLLDACEIVGLALLAVAAFGRVWCLLFVAGRKNQVLVTDGPYSVVRNPLYVFSFVGAVGFGLAVENPLIAVTVALAFAAYHHRVVRREEAYLGAAFGAAFEQYCARTPRWWPAFANYREPETLTLCPRTVRRGIVDAMWFIWAFLLWELAELLH